MTGMYTRLLPQTKKPKLWQRDHEVFWTDAHISQSLLGMHLDPNLELASRKAETIDSSVQWLSTILKPHSKICDLGCGPGLYTSRLAAMSYDVVGIDYSHRSITYAKEHDGQSRYICQNYLSLDFEDTFDAILMIYCDYAALTPNERVCLLQKVYRALKSHGIFVFDVFTFNLSKNQEQQPTWARHDEGGFWSPHPHVCLEAVYTYENNRISAHQYIVITEESSKEYIVWNTNYTVQALSAELNANCFQVVGMFDDICGTQYTGRAETLSVIASKSNVESAKKHPVLLKMYSSQNQMVTP